MKYIKTFEAFLNETSELTEGFMSELDIIRQESKSLQDFIQQAVKEYPQLKGKDAFLKEIWDTGKKLDESRVNVEELDTIEYVRPEYNGKIRNKLYKFNLKLKNNKTISARNIGELNQILGLSLDNKLSSSPDDFITVMKKEMPGVNVELGEYDVS